MSGEGDGPVTQSPDTSPEIEALQVALWRDMEPWQKWRQVCQLTAFCEQLALVGIGSRHPAATDAEQQLRLAALKYDRAFMRFALDWDADHRGW